MKEKVLNMSCLIGNLAIASTINFKITLYKMFKTSFLSHISGP